MPTASSPADVCDPGSGRLTPQQVAWIALAGGMLIMLLKLGIFWLTRSAAVLSDALESIINIVAAAIMIYSLWYSHQPADDDHPYGHGKIEFITLGLEGAMIAAAGLTIGWIAIDRLLTPQPIHQLDQGLWLLGVVNLLSAALAGFVYFAGRRFKNSVLKADAIHLATDVLSTLGVLAGLLLVKWTGLTVLDPIVALLLTLPIMHSAWSILRQSADGLMDRCDPQDMTTVLRILDEEVQRQAIASYHKVRLRHAGGFHWIDMHLQMDGERSVQQAHEIVSRIEYRIEQALAPGKATAHIEPSQHQPLQGDGEIQRL